MDGWEGTAFTPRLPLWTLLFDLWPQRKEPLRSQAVGVDEVSVLEFPVNKEVMENMLMLQETFPQGI